ncbi:MAG: hypothetical protein NT032_01220 [Actinobacteria bacterium]|nr:hypothetical protein [Actinomycetota bacterium]
MKRKWFLRLRSDSGSITAETAISISFLLICGFALVQVLTFAMQFQRLQTLAQESSRVAASLENPMILEKQILLFLKNINPDIDAKFDWQKPEVTVKLREPTYGLVSGLYKYVEASASAPRWSG